MSNIFVYIAKDYVKLAEKDRPYYQYVNEIVMTWNQTRGTLEFITKHFLQTRQLDKQWNIKQKGGQFKEMLSDVISDM